MSERIRALIVDDEPIAREGICVQLGKETDVEIIGECANGLEAVSAIQEREPNLVFLDVQMPGMDGFEVVQTIGADAMPAVVFVTAYDQYALQAFEVNAVDYLLKPFDAERFQRAYQRAKSQIQRESADEISQQLRTLLVSLKPEEKYLARLVIKSGGRIFFLPVDGIDWMEAADNYVSLHTGRETHLIRDTLTNLEAKLNPKDFVRIRHSAIVNVQRIRELHPLFKGEYEIILQSGVKLTSSRRYRTGIAGLLGE